MRHGYIGCKPHLSKLMWDWKGMLQSLGKSRSSWTAIRNQVRRLRCRFSNMIWQANQSWTPPSRKLKSFALATLNAILLFLCMSESYLFVQWALWEPCVMWKDCHTALLLPIVVIIQREGVDNFFGLFVYCPILLPVMPRVVMVIGQCPLWVKAPILFANLFKKWQKVGERVAMVCDPLWVWRVGLPLGGGRGCCPPSPSSRSIKLRPRLGSQQQPGGRRHPARQEVPKPLLHLQQRATEIQRQPSLLLEGSKATQWDTRSSLSLRAGSTKVVKLPIVILLSKSMLVALIVQTQFLFFLPRVLCGHRC